MNMNFINALRGVNFNKFNSSIQNAGSIQLDIENLKEWRGIQPDEIGLMDWGTDNNLPIVDLDQLINTEELAMPALEGCPPLQISFKKAVQIVVAMMNNSINSDRGEEDSYFLTSRVKGGELLSILSNIETKDPRQIPNPPRFGGQVCSAKHDEKEFWLGAILQMLYEEKHISGYGKKADVFWFLI